MSLFPKQISDRITEVDFAALAPRRFLIIDVDNTLALIHSEKVEQETVAYLLKQRAAGILAGICLVSNLGWRSSRRERRVASIARHLGAAHVYAYGIHVKPHSSPFRKAMRLMGARPEETIVIGDQLFTDIRGGNRLGLYTIYIPPLGKDHWFSRYRRPFERILLRYMRKKK